MVEKSLNKLRTSQGAVRKLFRLFYYFWWTGMYAPTSGARAMNYGVARHDNYTVQLQRNTLQIHLRDPRYNRMQG